MLGFVDLLQSSTDKLIRTLTRLPLTGDCTNPKHNMTNSDTVDSSLVGPHPHHIAMKKIRGNFRATISLRKITASS